MRTSSKQTATVKPASLKPIQGRADETQGRRRSVGTALDATQLKQVGGGRSIPVNGW